MWFAERKKIFGAAAIKIGGPSADGRRNNGAGY